MVGCGCAYCTVKGNIGFIQLSYVSYVSKDTVILNTSLTVQDAGVTDFLEVFLLR
jgi:hypothetical protein